MLHLLLHLLLLHLLLYLLLVSVEGHVPGVPGEMRVRMLMLQLVVVLMLGTVLVMLMLRAVLIQVFIPTRMRSSVFRSSKLRLLCELRWRLIARMRLHAKCVWVAILRPSILAWMISMLLNVVIVVVVAVVMLLLCPSVSTVVAGTTSAAGPTSEDIRHPTARSCASAAVRGSVRTGVMVRTCMPAAKNICDLRSPRVALERHPTG